MTRQSKKHKRIRIWSPSNGESFTKDDENCPLTNISILVGTKGIYGNLQKEGSPHLINLDLQDNKYWDSFFESSCPDAKPPPSIQETILYYSEPDDNLAAELELDIMEKVKTSIRSWRRIPSSFNNEISHRLRIIISDLEERKFNGLPPPSSSEYYAPLEGLHRGKNIFGFPIHTEFTGTSDILEEVKCTAIHESKHPDVEFSVAVRVFPYASNTFSVWIFLCTLVPEY